MTIISHTHKFIYIKARKVASSSVLLALGHHCKQPDIVTAPGDTEGTPRPAIATKSLRTHTHPEVIKKFLSPQEWDSYLKITSVRNPWDVAASMLLWRYYRRDRTKVAAKRLVVSAELSHALETRQLDVSNPEYRALMTDCINATARNCDMYFQPNGTPYADEYLRYETLQSDYDKLCTKLGFPIQNLPRLKAQSRTPGWDYQSFFDDILKAQVARVAHRTIDHFGYKF